MSLRPIACIFTLLLISLTGLQAQVDSAAPPSEPSLRLQGDNILNMMFLGDISPDKDIIESSKQPDGSYDFKPMFRYVQPILTTADIVAGNLNMNFSAPPYGLNGSNTAPPSFATDLAKAGVNFFFTANNQCLDLGRPGLTNSLRVLDSLGLRHAGTYTNCKERNNRSPSILYQNGYSVALLNYTFGTNQPGASWDCNVNLMISDWIKPDIIAAKSKKADFIVVYLNWGSELDRSPSMEQQSLAKELMDAGADLIVGTHSKTVQRVDWIRYVGGDENKYNLAAYSLGNFLTSGTAHYTDGGSILKVQLCRDSVSRKVMVCGYQFIPIWMHQQFNAVGARSFQIIPVSNAEAGNIGLSLDKSERARMNQFAMDSRNLLLPVIPEAKYNLNEDVVNDVEEMIHITGVPIRFARPDADTDIVYLKRKNVYQLGESLSFHSGVKAIRRSFSDVRISKDEMTALFGGPPDVKVIAKTDTPKTAVKTTPKSGTQYEYITVDGNGRKSLAEVKQDLKATNIDEDEIRRYDSIQRSRGLYDTSYRIQICALRSLMEVNLSKYPSAKGFEVTHDKNGYYYYFLGNSKSRASLEPMRQKLIQEGLADAFLVQFINRKRVNYFPLK